MDWIEICTIELSLRICFITVVKGKKTRGKDWLTWCNEDIFARNVLYSIHAVSSWIGPSFLVARRLFSTKQSTEELSEEPNHPIALNSHYLRLPKPYLAVNTPFDAYVFYSVFIQKNILCTVPYIYYFDYVLHVLRCSEKRVSVSIFVYLFNMTFSKR